MTNIINPHRYLERLAKPLSEKLKIVKYIPETAKNVLDVGCADGEVTMAMAQIFPDKKFLGIDLKTEFIKEAKKKVVLTRSKNVRFEAVYLRDLLTRPGRFDTVTFVSVLHEFYTYGEGISSVLKALADAHELLSKNGVIVIRDMILAEYTKLANLRVNTIVKKIKQKDNLAKFIKDFEQKFGALTNIYNLNHFLLKYLYIDNWQHELKEHYVAITFEQYEQIFKLLGMRTQFKESYTIPYLAERWKEDFGLTDDEITELKSTGFLVAEKMDM